MPRPVGWLRARMGVRAVSALAAAAVVAIALLGAGAALVLMVRWSLTESVEMDAGRQAQLIVERMDGNFESEANENAREALGALTRKDNDLAQILVAYGEDQDVPTWVLEAGTDPVGGDDDSAPPMSELRPERGETSVLTNHPVRRMDGTVENTVLVVSGAQSDGRHVVVLLAAPLAGVAEATHTVLFYLLCGFPLLLVVAGVATYLFAGRALRPVEAIRAQVAEMSEDDLAQRVPVPPARDEVGRLAETMNAMIGRLEHSQSAMNALIGQLRHAQAVQTRFVADASHELRSPLATIATGLELMQKGQGGTDTVPVLRGETDRLTNMVEELLLLARADERGLQPNLEDVDLDEVAEGERGRPVEGSVATEVRAGHVRVVGDRGQLGRVVRNLVDNARRHARSRVLVTVRREENTAVLEVADDGPGVPVEERGRVFERFVRLDDSRARRDGGSGLGLAIVDEVVKAHGGTVEVTDAEGGGALFRVRIPAAPEQPPQPEPDPEPVDVDAQKPLPKRVPAAQRAATPERAEAKKPSPIPAPRKDPPVTRPPRPEPVRDDQARRDPATMPGFPAVAPER